MAGINWCAIVCRRETTAMTMPARVSVSAVAVGVVCATLCVLVGAALWIGTRVDSDVRFLDPLRAPTLDEASIALAGEYATRSHEANDVVFLGDSACRQG